MEGGKDEMSRLPAVASREAVVAGAVDEAAPMGLSARRKSINGMVSSLLSVLSLLFV